MKFCISKLIQHFRDFTIVGFINFTILKLTNREILIGGSCHCCGACCRSLCLDDGKGWIRREKDFKSVVEDNPDYSCFKIIGRDNSGYLLFSCTSLLDNGKCGRYDNRFQFCKDFPDPQLPFCGGQLPKGCGYVFRSVVPFSKILSEEINKSNEKNPHT